MLLLAFLTYYGQNSGNFVMSVDEDAFKRGIAISDKKDFSTQNRWLTADPVEDVRDTTLAFIDIEEIINTEGAYKQTRSNYLAYTFFLTNVGSEATAVDYEVDGDFPHVTYDEAVDIINSKGVEMDWGEDLSRAAEKALGDTMGGFYFLTKWPSAIKPFYVMPFEDDEK